ncbi:aldo/keto reductase [Reyranella sp.]|uniref:aldo/keto reductase n=1 Tax=Reyranella sp. TaxID=1929291 RepID=UPI003BA8ED0C
MKYGPLGRSGLIVSRICLGGNSWGAKGRRGWGKFDEAEAPAYFRRALDVGITFFDTADAYNAGRSEEIMGATLMKMAKREDIVLSTKVGIRMSDSANDVGTGRKHLMSAVDAQLRRLQTDYIDVYQVHRLDPHTPIEETMYSLDQLVRSGKVRYIGGSTMPAYKFAQMLMIADWKGYARPIAMQNLYNLVQREEEREMNRLCHEQGVGLIPYSPLARGFLAGNRSRDGGGDTERSKNDAQVKAGTYRDGDWEVVDRLKKIAAGKNASPAQAALAWLLGKPYMGAPIIGATSLEQLTSAAEATELTLTADETAMLEEPYAFRVPPEN